MKLTHIAQVLTLALLVVTTYLALQARDESVKTRAVDDQRAQQMNQQLQAIAAQSAATVMLPPPVPAPVPAPAPAVVTPPPSTPVRVSSRAAESAPSAPVLAKTEPKTSSHSAGSPSPSSPPERKPFVSDIPNPATAPMPALADVPLTPLQRKVKASPSLGQVKEYQADQGFVVLSAGSKQGLREGITLDLRRDASIVGRIKITSVEETESVADVEPKSVPTGVTLQTGDEIIGVVLAP